MSVSEDLSHLHLPPDVLERLAELDLELAEGTFSPVFIKHLHSLLGTGRKTEGTCAWVGSVLLSGDDGYNSEATGNGSSAIERLQM